VKTIERYVFGSFLSSFVLAFLVLSFVLTIGLLVQIVGYIMDGVPMRLVGEFAMVSLPETLQWSVPLSLLVSAILVFSRLSADGEIAGQGAVLNGGFATDLQGGATVDIVHVQTVQYHTVTGHEDHTVDGHVAVSHHRDVRLVDHKAVIGAFAHGNGIAGLSGGNSLRQRRVANAVHRCHNGGTVCGRCHNGTEQGNSHDDQEQTESALHHVFHSLVSFLDCELFGIPFSDRSGEAI
jgi:hypothetical protein